MSTLIIQSTEVEGSPLSSRAVWTSQLVKRMVLDLLKEMNQPTLAKLSGLSQSMISNIANDKYKAIITSETCKEFGEWYIKYKTEERVKSFASPEKGGNVTPSSRLTFHPKYELPLLRGWFQKTKTPSEPLLIHYVNELNRGHVRQERPKVTLDKLKIWWKNERQKERKQRVKEKEALNQSNSGETREESTGGPQLTQLGLDEGPFERVYQYPDT
ncbi:uncharacterized protein LOC106167793 [Lingula anatina]|uniref:Uncharacterized protein LOC106167793 n=1 Tax=Lingula anatina TaxID=7574 RepID=A0A1S3IV92_LINAN|nr:uncharacterized protein LOC106167793 [Lingula anatina]|eukprot:XP_013402117.1 uncharacterized protein LOC106167793 [Lingula anatina]